MRNKKVLALCALTFCVSLTGCALLPFSENEGSGGDHVTSNQETNQEEEPVFNSQPSGEKEEDTEEDTEEPEEDQDMDISALGEARRLAAQYNYDEAIELLQTQTGYESDSEMQAAVEEFEAIKATCTPWPLDKVTHVFYHTLVYDTDLAFDGDSDTDGYNQVMTTVDEFNAITQSMYDKGFVMVSMEDMARKDENGVMQPQEILLPPGKQPFVLSQDDVSYYHYMDGDGMAARLVLDENGDVKNEYIEADGSVSVGDYDMVPLIDSFVKEHPDFSYKGAKGILALTGYNGILGYRTDQSYADRPADLNADKVAWLEAHPDFDLEEERAGAKRVAEVMLANGWEFASHTWGHLNVGTVDIGRLQTDTQNWLNNVAPLVGGTDKIIFAFGADMAGAEDYSGEKFEYLKSQGFDYFCNVDSSQYWVQLRSNYLRMGRRNLDGYRMYHHPQMVQDLFDANAVFDKARPTPVPTMG